MAKTKAPSGMTLTRENGKFTGKWKIADKDYRDGQAAQYRLGKGKWQNLSIGTGTTSKAFTVDKSKYYPTAGKSTLKWVDIRVRGNRAAYTEKNVRIDPTVSDWTKKTFNFNKPKKPSIKVNVGTWPQTTFEWNVDTDKANSYWFTDVQIQSVLVKDSNVTDGAKVNWNSTVGTKYDRTGSATGSLAITEDSGQLNDGHSYTRWIRIRSRGVAGASEWRYAKHVYALPNQAIITDWQVTRKEEENGYLAKIWYNSPYSAARPIKEIETQYAIAVPDLGLECPDGASWQTGSKALVKDKTGGAVFSIDSLLAADQCLFVRVNVVYDDKTTYGNPVMVDSGILAAPSGLTVQTDPQQYTATITATNNSAVQDSFLVVKYLSAEDPDGFDIGIIPHGQTSVTVQCPQWDSQQAIVFAVYAVVGTYEETVREDGVTSYAVTPVMESAVVRSGGTVPVAPDNVSVQLTDIAGTIRVIWDWSWQDADAAELSWADHADAWESTDEPDTYTVTRLRQSAWNISGLQTGKKWFVRVRLIQTDGEKQTFGAYSDTMTINLSSAPVAPVISLSESVITEEGTITASWIYTSTDGTGQAFAEIAEVTEDSGAAVYETIAQTLSAQNVTITAADQGWIAGETHSLAVRVVSASGESSEWSAAVALYVADPITCTIAQTSLVEVTESTTDEEGETITWTVNALTEMPLTVTVEGAGTAGITSLIIERADTYSVDRPDESNFTGYEGEAVAVYSQTGEDQITITQEELTGALDDGANYRLIVTVNDDLGQSAMESIEFSVLWAHQAEAPSASVLMDAENMIARLTPIAPAGAAADDVCDIYRLSVDKPELIYESATFGTEYVDPFPTLGDFGGHRFVTRTANGDYITTEEQFAWYDTGVDQGDVLESEYNIIEFGTGRALIRYNIDLQSDWEKDFEETKYLGGSVQGDWNNGVSRSGSINGVAVRTQDQDLITTMRRLAVWPGICHVRTKEGSSFPADVQVSESVSVSDGHKISAFTLNITKVDAEELDGLTFAEWQETQGE